MINNLNKKYLIIILIFFKILFISNNVFATENNHLKITKIIPRKVLALYNSKYEKEVTNTRLAQYAEMPLNHLGIILEYQDINKELLDIKNNPEYLGVITWFDEKIDKNTDEYLTWLLENIDNNKKLVILGEPGFEKNNLENKLYKKLGVFYDGSWNSEPYTSKISYLDKKSYDFEYKLKSLKIAYPIYHALPEAKSYLKLSNRKNESKYSDLVVTSNNGGIIANGYAIYSNNIGEIEIRSWRVNPFKFFNNAFYLQDTPKPDTTTILGKRIFYSHIDGDGWNNITLINNYKGEKILSAEVIYQRVLKAYPDIPVTVGPIGADIDEEWVGKKSSIKIAQKIGLLENIEMGSHTYSHPFFWKFFEVDGFDKEKKFLNRYPHKTWGETKTQSFLRRSNLVNEKPRNIYDLPEHYKVPRGFASKKYSTEKEITGSKDYINSIIPNKKVKIILWSGDTTPYYEAIDLAYKNNLYNINGGDSRFDKVYPSYAWVAPIGRRIKDRIQIFSSNSNENTYTNLWEGPYFGFSKLIETIYNTESPIRIKPFNIYYHMYSGERKQSLRALIDNIEYAKKSNIIPITASQYSKLALGFYSTKILKIDENKWQIKNRGALNTIRLDNAKDMSVDFDISKGVIGQNIFQNSLYIFLEPNNASPIIKVIDKNNTEYKNNKSYIEESSWLIKNYQSTNGKISFEAQGFGSGKIKLFVPNNYKYKINIFQNIKNIKSITKIASNNILELNLDINAIEGVLIELHNI